jgi:membrane dipeptidase
VFDSAELDEYLRANPQLFPPEAAFKDGIRMVAPESLRSITAGLLARGYRATELRKILGGNFMRVAQATWPTTVGRA